jgi:hypothetical protein
MQLTKDQVRQTLVALTVSQTGTSGRTPPRTARRDVVSDALEALPAGLLEDLERAIDVRADRLDAARAWLCHVDDLSADELADRIVGRLVCDRLR